MKIIHWLSMKTLLINGWVMDNYIYTIYIIYYIYNILYIYISSMNKFWMILKSLIIVITSQKKTPSRSSPSPWSRLRFFESVAWSRRFPQEIRGQKKGGGSWWISSNKNEDFTGKLTGESQQPGWTQAFHRKILGVSSMMTIGWLKQHTIYI